MSAQKLRSYLSRLSPIPGFPEYSGPYKVGSIDVEIPVSELDSPSPAPGAAADIHTIQFRIFYPATPDSNGPPISWLPAPQRLNVASYAQFLGIGPRVASVLSFLPRHLYYSQIPVNENAALQPPDTPNGQWPTAIFSHGLGGNRNAYSYFAGSMASHGVVVICPEHRDGSALSLIRDPKAQGRGSAQKSPRIVPYTHLPHTQTPDVFRARDEQVRIRLWELGLLVEAVVGLGSGVESLIQANLTGGAAVSALQQFAGKMDVHEPGKIIWAGHSFGAATIAHVLKLTYYADHPEVTSMPDPVFTPRKDSNIRRLITEKNPTILLDLWCLPVTSATFALVFNLPFPAYADVPTAPGGTALLAVESDSFYKWTEQMHITARLLSADPAARVISPAAYERQGSDARLPEPNVFYVRNSAHLNQSDFGVLFPWLCKKAFGAEEPERAMRLNVRAALQHLRANGVAVARTCADDLVDGGLGEGEELDDGVDDDKAILDGSADGSIEAWCWIDTMGMGEKSGLTELELLSRRKEGEETSEREDPEMQMEAEMEPGLAPLETGPSVDAVKQATVGATAA